MGVGLEKVHWEDNSSVTAKHRKPFRKFKLAAQLPKTGADQVDGDSVSVSPRHQPTQDCIVLYVNGPCSHRVVFVQHERMHPKDK